MKKRRGASVARRSRRTQNHLNFSLLVLFADVRVGTDVVTDPAFLVTRPMEDFVTWVDTSKIKRKVLKYNDRLDDYDLLN